MKYGYARPAALPRTAVNAICPDVTPLRRQDIDCTKDRDFNPNMSAKLYGISGDRYDILAVRTEAQDIATKERDEQWCERTFAYEGLGVRMSGRNKTYDPDAGLTRGECDGRDEALRDRGRYAEEPIVPRLSTYEGMGTEAHEMEVHDMKVRRRIPVVSKGKGKGRMKVIATLVGEQTTHSKSNTQTARKSIYQATTTA